MAIGYWTFTFLLLWIFLIGYSESTAQTAVSDRGYKAKLLPIAYSLLPNSQRFPDPLTEPLQFSPDQLFCQETGMIGDYDTLQMIILMLNDAGP